MDVLDIHVDPMELDTLMESETYEWPEEGQACPIPNCPSKDHIFIQIGSYRAHFLRTHIAQVPFYHCYDVECGFWTRKQNPLRRHILACHPSLQGCVWKECRPNPIYCSPGNIGMPVPPVHREARDLAARARRSQSAQSTSLFRLPSTYNARDQKPKF